uniref:DUF4795 domain-containing protein n=1 Tax=Arion vulgaris TaxID=1028688 RepID=A0A0B6ZLE6_9EUPU
MPTPVSLSHLVDLALGSPEIGAVNFNVLHTLLHAMIQKLNIQDVKADVDEHDRELLSTHQGTRAFSAFSAYSADSGKGDDSFSISEDGLSDKSSYPTSKRSPYHKLERRVAELIKQIDDLNKLPTNEQLIGVTLGKESERPVSDMWQNMQLKKRVDVNQEGIDKVMSLVEDLMKEMKELKDAQKYLLDKVSKIDMDNINKRLNAMDDLYKNMNDKYDGINDKLSNVPNLDDLNDFVTWPGLEDALKGVRQDFESLQPISEEKVVIELGVQTETPEPKGRPGSSKPASRSSSARSRMSNLGGPTSELLDILERLGKLSDSHEMLKQRVDELEKLLELKANKTDLDGLGMSEELLTSLNNLKEEVENFKDGQLKDGVVMRRLQDAVQKLQADIEKLQMSMEIVTAENTERVKEIQDLVQYCDSLNARKADKEYVDTEVDVKADRNQLEGKVNHSLFDTTTSELNRMIKDILDKLNGHDGDWKSALAKAMEELDGKLDRREMSNLKEWLEKQLKALNNKIKTMGPGWQLDDEAAGMKRQLIQRFHCLSCDKPINVMPHSPIPSIPSSYGLPKFNSARPYMTFELDQIRQHAKSLGMNPEYMDYYASIRQCGGSHTLTFPQKRITKQEKIGQLLREEETIVPLYKEEVDVQGADGQIYKGRLGTSRLEAKISSNLTSQHTHPIYMEQRVYSPQPSGRPSSAKVSRPTSGRPMSSQSNQRFRPGSSHVRIAQVVIAPDVSQAEESRTSTPHPDELDASPKTVAEEDTPVLEEQEKENEEEENNAIDA